MGPFWPPTAILCFGRGRSVRYRVYTVVVDVAGAAGCVVTTAVPGAGVTTALAAGWGCTVVSCLYSQALRAAMPRMASRGRYFTDISQRR